MNQTIMNYIIQKVRTKSGKKMIMVYKAENGVLMATFEYNFNVNMEAIELLGLCTYTMLLEELTIEGKEFNFYKKYKNLI